MRTSDLMQQFVFAVGVKNEIILLHFLINTLYLVSVSLVDFLASNWQTGSRNAS